MREYILGGKKIPSVTKVLGILEKPGLLDWAWQTGRSGKDYKEIRFTEAQVGTLVHQLISSYFLHGKTDISFYTRAEIAKGKIAFESFRAFAKGKNLVPRLIEESLISAEWGYGGTPDFYGKVNEEDILIDFKTSKEFRPEMLIQLAAYRNLLGENNFGYPPAMIVRLDKYEPGLFAEVRLEQLDRQWEAFKHLLHLYHILREDLTDDETSSTESNLEAGAWAFLE